MKKILILIVILGAVLLSAGLLVKTTPTAPNNTRVILDHTLKVYVTPPCFDQAELTNFLEETTLQTANKLGYEMEGACTEESLSADATPVLLQWLQLTEMPWGKDGQW